LYAALVVFGSTLSLSQVAAQEFAHNTSIATPVPISDAVYDGDIITYDVADGVYRPASTYSDEAMFGVIVLNPVLYMAESTSKDGTYPVVRFGEAVVNVSTLGGDIHAGDLITTSLFPGRGQRVTRQNIAYVLGLALEPMQIDTSITPITVEGNTVRFGKVPVALRIGQYVPGDLAETIASTTALLARITPQNPIAQNAQFDFFRAFRFVLAALVATGSIIISLRRFNDMFSKSVVSIGRNPLARTHIRALLIWNVLLTLFISGIGLSVSAALILIP